MRAALEADLETLPIMSDTLKLVPTSPPQLDSSTHSEYTRRKQLEKYTSDETSGSSNFLMLRSGDPSSNKLNSKL
jgi:hypothetical protein